MLSSHVPDPGEVRQINFINENTGDIGISFHPEKECAAMRPLHGLGNFAPLQNSGMQCRLPVLDMIRALQVPYSYFHDAPYENPGLDLIDISRLFPISSADENDPANYRFAENDAYLQNVVDSGTGIIFRLGESIEVSSGRRYRVNPPADYEKWANICLNIIRHYNEGWGDGFHWNIRDWAIWEEPNNPNLWTGKFEDYLRLYEVTSRKIKAAFPELRVGGPQTTTLGIRFLEQFLAFCREKDLPLDFVNYTAYYHTPAELLAETFVRRKIIDSYGYADVPMMINEWHGSPVWQSFSDHVGYLRESNRVGGFDGAVFAGTVLCGLQDTPVEKACYYAAATFGGYGLFNERRQPTPQYFLFEKFCGMFNNARRRIALELDCDEPNVKGLAVLSNSENIEAVIGCYLRKSRTINITIPRGYQVDSVEIINRENPAFTTLRPWDFTLRDNTLSLRKTEEPELFFVRFTEKKDCHKK